MGSDHKALRAAIKFFSGETEHTCRLCFALTKNQEISMDDCAVIEKQYCEENVAFYDMFKELGVSFEPTLPQVLCSKCATEVTNSYSFKRFCQHSDEKWNEILDILSKGLFKAETVSPNVLSAYLIVNSTDNIMFTSRKTHTMKSKKIVLSRIKNIVKNTQYIKLKKSNPVQCEDCGIKFKSNYLLTKHNTNMHHKTSYPCEQCTKVFQSALQLEWHRERVHDPKKIKCMKCNKMFSSVRLLNYHDKLHHIATICKLCFVQLPSKKDLRHHLDWHEVLNCPKCEKSFMNKNTYKYHVKACGNSDHKTPKFLCDMCDKGYVQKNGLKGHLRVDHGFGDVFTCQWCGKKFDAISRLNNHIVKHTKEKKFRCEQCGRKFVTRAALVYHSRLHTGERPFPCDLCDESFLSASRRMEHKHRKHFEPTLECPVCHEKFVTRIQLRRHAGRHYNPLSKLYIPDAEGSQLKELIDRKNMEYSKYRNLKFVC